MSINIGKAVGYLELDTSKFRSGFKSAFEDLKGFTDKTATAGQRAEKLASAFGTAGSVMTKNVTLPLLGVGVASTNVAVKFESAMSEVKAISGATGEDFDKLKEKAKEMGAKTKFSATESAEAFKYMAMAGWETEDMLDGIEGVMDLASASGEDLAEVSDIVTDSLTAFGLSAKDSAHFADVLATASSKSNTNVALMGETFQYVAPVAGALGYSVEDTAVAIGLMANAGIKGSQAGTSLRAMLSRMVKPTDDVASAMDDLGINITNADGSMKPLSQTMIELREKFSGLSESQKAQYASTIAGQEAMSGLLAIVNASDEDFAKLTEEIGNADGSAKAMSETMLDNTAGALTILKSSLEGLGIIIGEQLTPYIRAFAEWITNLTEKFNGMSEGQQEVITKVGIFLALLGPVLLVMSKVIRVVLTVSKLIKGIPLLLGKVSSALSAISLPVVAVIALITSLILAFKHLWETNTEFREAIIEIWEEIKEKIKTFTADIKEKLASVGITFDSIIEFLKTVWEGFCGILAPQFIEAFELISATLGVVLDTISGFVGFVVALFEGDWNTAFEEVKNVWESVWGYIMEVLGIFGEVILNFVDVVLGFFGTSWEELWQGVSDFFVGIWEGIVTFFTETIPAFIASIIEWFRELPTNLGILVGEMIGYIYLFAQNCWAWITEELPLIIQGIIEWFATLPSRIWEWLTAVISNIIQWGSDLVTEGTNSAQEFLNSVIETITSLPEDVWEIIKQIPEKVVELGTELYEAGCDAFNDLWEGISSVGDQILGWVEGFAESVAGFVSGIVSGFQSIVGWGNEASTATASVNGSHANGLSYVPFDGYIAELHEGERVLTKKEAKEYNKGNGNSGGGDTYNFYNTQPNPYEYARQFRKVKKELLYGM